MVTIKNIREVSEPLKEQILKGDVQYDRGDEGMVEAFGL
jgi:hypothetical protein